MLAAWPPADKAAAPAEQVAAAAPADDVVPADAWQATQDRYRQIDTAPSDPVEAVEWRAVLCSHMSGEFGGDNSERDRSLSARMDELRCGDELAADTRALRTALARRSRPRHPPRRRPGRFPALGARPAASPRRVAPAGFASRSTRRCAASASGDSPRGSGPADVVSPQAHPPRAQGRRRALTVVLWALQASAPPPAEAEVLDGRQFARRLGAAMPVLHRHEPVRHLRPERSSGWIEAPSAAKADMNPRQATVHPGALCDSSSAPAWPPLF
jgi:hypothetical protein